MVEAPFPADSPEVAYSKEVSKYKQVLRAGGFLVCRGARRRGCLWSRSAGWRFTPGAAPRRGKCQSATQTGGSAGVTL